MSELSPDREAELERSRAFKHRGWRIATDCGLPPSEADKVWDIVWLEMNFYCPDFMKGMSIAHHARCWIENRNPFHIDAAVVLCGQVGIRPPPALAELVLDVARRRLTGEIQSGTPAKIMREAAKDHALNMMVSLCAAGLTREEAASKAAAQLLHPQFAASYNASSLEKWYTKKWRDREAQRRDYWATPEGAEQREEWLNIIPLLPDAPPELKGERR